MPVLDVLIFRGVNKTYSYRSLDDEIVVGHLAEIPLGRGRAKGLVVGQREEDASSLKPILGLVKKKPVIDQSLLDLIQWFSEHYRCTPYKAFQTIVGTKSIREVDEVEAQEPKEPPYSLTDEQQAVISDITSHPFEYSMFYLRGVTGSGKTEIYMQLAAHLLRQNKTTLILVPEIALTPQYTRLFEERFGDVISVIHSGLTPKQRDVEWNRIQQGIAKVIIGPRSAIFSPVQDLGLIIVDEEHEPSYKQDSHPRYDTHAVAEFRAAYHGAWLLYGSATPRVETFAQCKELGTPIYELSGRVLGQALPPVEIVDMAEAYRNHEGGIVSKCLEAAIQKRIEAKEKVMILVNRRGFATYVVCQKCNTVHECQQCGLSYTYHDDKSFRCHRCGIITGISHTCRSCGSDRLAFAGTGIQKVELELNRLFPFAKTLRLDKDTASTTKKMEAILSEFRMDGDILIGTQLIAKGHHIESVTLVGVIGIDTTLNLPDFRSPERTFQLLTQVAGRAGRGEKPGEVVVQTLQPEHPSIISAQTHDFHAFYEREMMYRDQLGYPPFKALIHIILSATDENELKGYCRQFEKQLFEILGDSTPFIGPKPAPIEKIRNHYRWDVVIKCHADSLDELKEAFDTLPVPPKTIRVMFDYDPYSLL